MALHWEEAREVVTFGDMREMGEATDDAIVVALRPDEASDPETVEAVRNLVLDRTIERRRRVISDAYELGTTLPDPTVEPERGEGADERAEAERRLLEVLGEHDGEADASDLDDDWVGGRAPLSEAGLWLGGEPGRGVRIFISHVEELVVHN